MFPVAQMNILVIKYNLHASLKTIGGKKKEQLIVSYPLISFCSKSLCIKLEMYHTTLPLLSDAMPPEFWKGE
jgi:hypothetical protein